MTVQDLIDPRFISRHKKQLPLYSKELYMLCHSLQVAQQDGTVSFLLGSQFTPFHCWLLFGVQLLSNDHVRLIHLLAHRNYFGKEYKDEAAVVEAKNVEVSVVMERSCELT